MYQTQRKAARMSARRGTSRASANASPGSAATKFMIGTALFGCMFILFTVHHLTPEAGLDEPLPRARPLEQPVTSSGNLQAQNSNDKVNTPPQQAQALQENGVKYHHIFSTGCSSFQDWQSYVFYVHVLKSGQQGDVTRVAACKTDEEADKLRAYHKEYIEPMSPNFHLHITPDYTGFKDGHDFKYFNKPFSTHHFMENVLGYNPQHQKVGDNPNDDTIVVLFDPDQAIMRPFTDNHFDNDYEVWVKRTSHPIEATVTHGKPMAQLYGFGNQWKTKTNITRYVPASELPSFVQTMSREEELENYSVGPPYMATAHDFYKIATKWKDFVPLVHDDYPHLLAEMFAYCLAAAHLKLPHQVAKSFMVSDAGAGKSLEGWGLIDSYSRRDMCTPGAIPKERLPHVLHYCQRYILGKYVIGKHRVPHTFLSCEDPLFVEPPPDIGEKYNFAIEPDRKEDVKKDLPVTTISNHAFMLCHLLPILNEAAIYFKDHHCEGKTVNREKTLVFYNSMEIDPKFFQ